MGLDASENNSGDEGSAIPGAPKLPKRKMALTIGFIGLNYRGLQINYAVEATSAKKSVEAVLRDALVKIGALAACNAEQLEIKANWSRASRTDAGVSALRLVIAARLLVDESSFDAADRSQALVDALNAALPDDVRCFSATRVPKSFDAKRSCSWREYAYYLPIEMARGKDDAETSPGELCERFQAIMRKFEGCHSFHNFSRLKAADVAWNREVHAADEEGAMNVGSMPNDDAKCGSSKGKGKGKRKGKNDRSSRKRKATQEPDAAGSDLERVPDEPPRVSCSGRKIAAIGSNVVLEDASKESEGCGDGESKAIEPVWTEICRVDPETNSIRERLEAVVAHAQSTMYMISVELARGGAFLRIILRGQFFVYNQIRLMVGTAAAVCSGVLPVEILELALLLRQEFHMPLAPPTGLMLLAAGFSMMDARTGSCAMDPEQARDVLLPETGIVLMNETGAAAVKLFQAKIEEAIEGRWAETGEVAEWSAKIWRVQAPSGELLEMLRRLGLEASGRFAEAERLRTELDMKRAGAHFACKLPKRFGVALMVRFQMMPGWRVNYIQDALVARLRAWAQNPEDRPPGISALPQTDELLGYIGLVGLSTLTDEGFAQGLK